MSIEEKIEKTRIAETQIIDNQQKLSYDLRTYSVERFLEMYKSDLENTENEFVLNNNPKNVWDIEKQSKFIQSVILGVSPIYMVIMVEIPETYKLEIVDGKYYLKTLDDFINNRLGLSKLNILTSLEGFYFTDLSIPRQRKFKNVSLKTVVFSGKDVKMVKNELITQIFTKQENNI